MEKGNREIKERKRKRESEKIVRKIERYIKVISCY